MTQVPAPIRQHTFKHASKNTQNIHDTCITHTHIKTHIKHSRKADTTAHTCSPATIPAMIWNPAYAQHVPITPSDRAFKNLQKERGEERGGKEDGRRGQQP